MTEITDLIFPVVGAGLTLKVADRVLTDRKPSRKCKRKFKITYNDPIDRKGLKSKTWSFCSRSSAEDRRDDLALFWGVQKSKIKIRKVT